ncbi:Adenine nucleotide alpha hydrolases-like superfamily protein [Euphorbia peplus]|nr:Adenine nucleotide alpha hydrolases-like superfamily protein [Euphorbia peplus]
MPSSTSFLRQFSGRREVRGRNSRSCDQFGGFMTQKMELGGGYYGSNNNNNYGNINGGVKKRVMVVVDQKSYSKHAMIWALTHVANKGDLLTLLHIIPPFQKTDSGSDSDAPYLAKSLGSLCKACKPEVDVEALVIQGPKIATVMNQVKKLDVAVLVLGQKKPSPLLNCLCGNSSSEEFVEQCINNVECLTIGVSKQSKSVGGYLISTRWKKNFWLLA